MGAHRWRWWANAAAEYKGKREAEKRGKGGGSPPRVRIYSLWFDKRSQRL